MGQVHQYIDAIQSGFVAAQYGYTAADDIISLSQVLDSTTKEEREAYMIGTLELANKAYAASTESYQAFRSIGATLVFVSNNLLSIILTIQTYYHHSSWSNMWMNSDRDIQER